VRSFSRYPLAVIFVLALSSTLVAQRDRDTYSSASANSLEVVGQVRMAESLPMKLAVFDGQNGLLALLDPVITRPTWTAVVFRHEGMGEAMKALFEERWRRGTDL